MNPIGLTQTTTDTVLYTIASTNLVHSVSRISGFCVDLLLAFSGNPPMRALPSSQEQHSLPSGALLSRQYSSTEGYLKTICNIFEFIFRRPQSFPSTDLALFYQDPIPEGPLFTPQCFPNERPQDDSNLNQIITVIALGILALGCAWIARIYIQRSTTGFTAPITTAPPAPPADVIVALEPPPIPPPPPKPPPAIEALVPPPEHKPTLWERFIGKIHSVWDSLLRFFTLRV